MNPSGRASAVDFLVGLLSYGDICNKEREIDPILKIFAELDIDKDGLLTTEDLERFVAKYNEIADPNKSLVSVVVDDVKSILFGDSSTRSES